MQKAAMRKALSILCAFILTISMLSTVFATEISNNTDENTEILEQAVANIQDSIVTVENRNTENVIQGFDIVEKENVQINVNARENWMISDDIFMGYESITADDTHDFYIVHLSSTRAPALKIISTNTNMGVQLCTLKVDEQTGSATIDQWTNFIDNANDTKASVLSSLSAGYYGLYVGSWDSSEPTGDYKLMWNCSNPGGASTVVAYDENLTKVVLGYTGNPARICCNGVDWIADMEWEEHYTFNTSTGHSGRDQSISDIHPERINMGTYTSSQHTAKNALFVAAGERSLWLYVRTQYSNVNGSVVHDMDYFDISGRKTPRRFDETDVSNGPHYVVYDMDTNEVIDFISPYNYLWQTGATKASITFTATDILG